MVPNNTEDYFKLPYHLVLTPELDGGYSAEILEFPGCFADGSTPNEAIAHLKSTVHSWIEASLQIGHAIPEPLEIGSYSGRIQLRLPRDIHRRATQMAEVEGVSLNQFILVAVAMRIGAEELAERVSKSAAFISVASTRVQAELIPD
jgi:predicted RNase H-like HicB family nuclease